MTWTMRVSICTEKGHQKLRVQCELENFWQHLNQWSEPDVALKLEMAVYSWISPLLDSRLPLWPSHVWILTISSVQPAPSTPPPPSYSTCSLFIPSRLLQRSQRGSTDLCVHDNSQATRSVCCSLFALVARGEEIKASASGNSRDVQESNSGKPLNDNVPLFCSQPLPVDAVLDAACAWLCFAGWKFCPVKLKHRSTLRHKECWRFCNYKARTVQRISRWNVFEGKFLSHFKIC